MTIRLIFMEFPWTAAVLNHLWQSTAVFLAIWLLALVLRDSHASVRYRLWMAASLKFLLPFALLMHLGAWLRAAFAAWHPAMAKHAALTAGAARLSMPFEPQSFVDVSDPGIAVAAASHMHALVAVVLVAAVWLCGAGTVVFRCFREWRRIHDVLLESSPVTEFLGVPVRTHEGSIEPGVVGLLRPCILLPASVFSAFPKDQIDAILAHELCHIRRRDNLTAFLHMCISSIFWFHPAVWTIRRRMLEEREWACDEAVLLAGNRPETYAESILGVCRWYLASPVAHMSGVSGANLKQRVVRIMTGAVSGRMSRRARAVVVAAVMLGIGFALAPGLFSDPIQPADDVAGLPKFTVVSIHPTQQEVGNCGLSKEGYHCEVGSLTGLLESAYGIKNSYQFVHLPPWATSSHYDVEAKVDPADISAINALHYKQRLFMLRPVLADRFHLKAHWETRTLPVYLLKVAKGGSKLKAPTPEDTTKTQTMGEARIGAGGVMSEINGMTIGQEVPVSSVVELLSRYTNRIIIDRTGLTGLFDFSVQLPSPKATEDGRIFIGMSSESMVSTEQAAEADPTAGATLFSAVGDLGLQLVSTKAAVQVLVIDEVQPPSEN